MTRNAATDGGEKACWWNRYDAVDGALSTVGYTVLLVILLRLIVPGVVAAVTGGYQHLLTLYPFTGPELQKAILHMVGRTDPLPLMVAWVLWMVLINFRTIQLYREDQWAEQNTGSPWVSEATLHRLTGMGGWLGAMVAHGLFQHKVAKPGFIRTFRVVWATHLLTLLCVLFFASHPANLEAIMRASATMPVALAAAYGRAVEARSAAPAGQPRGQYASPPARPRPGYLPR